MAESCCRAGLRVKGKVDDQAGSGGVPGEFRGVMAALDGKLAAEKLDALAHAAQAVALAQDRVLAIVFDDETAMRGFVDEAETVTRWRARDARCW